MKYRLAGYIIVFFTIFSCNRQPPEGQEGDRAEAMAQKILTAVNKKAWDSLRYVHWTFRGQNSYLWDKEKHSVKVYWDNVEVYFHTKTGNGGCLWIILLQKGVKNSNC